VSPPLHRPVRSPCPVAAPLYALVSSSLCFLLPPLPLPLRFESPNKAPQKKADRCRAFDYPTLSRTSPFLPAHCDFVRRTTTGLAFSDLLSQFFSIVKDYSVCWRPAFLVISGQMANRQAICYSTAALYLTPKMNDHVRLVAAPPRRLPTASDGVHDFSPREIGGGLSS